MRYSFVSNDHWPKCYYDAVEVKMSAPDGANAWDRSAHYQASSHAMAVAVGIVHGLGAIDAAIAFMANDARYAHEGILDVLRTFRDETRARLVAGGSW